MDPNSELSVVIYAISSSVRSLASFFSGLLKMNPTTGEGPINRLPNEMMLLIVAKLGQDGDGNKLVRLRLVSTKWKLLVEDYCAQKKSLIVQPNFESFWFEERFFGFAKMKDFTILQKLKIGYMPSECLSGLLQMFPNIERLSINCRDEAQFHQYVVYINSLDSLKQLSLGGYYVSDLSILTPILSNLEYLAFDFLGRDFFFLRDDENPQLISHLAPNCVRVYFKCDFTYGQVRQWRSINPHWLANVTHLRIGFKNGRNDGPQLVHFLAEYATSLKHLSLHFEYLPYGLVLTPAVIGDFGKMANLVELKLVLIGIDFSSLEHPAELHQLASLNSVLKCELSNINVFSQFRAISADAFTRALSVILPNLVELYLYIGNEYVKSDIFQGRVFEQEFEQHLHRFSMLRKHAFYFLDDQYY